MKKVFSILLVAMMIVTLCSCQPSEVKSQLTGNWFTCTENGDLSSILELRFTESTVSQYMLGNFIRSGTYTISGNSVICDFDANEKYDEHQLILKYSLEDELKLKTEDSEWWNLKKSY